MGARTKTSRWACGFTLVAFVLILIAFVSPYWLQTDGDLPGSKFQNLGKNKHSKGVSQKMFC